VVWIPYAEDDKQRFDELAALYLICRKRLQEINIETKMVASPGSVAHRDEQTLASHDLQVPDPAQHLITFTAQSYLHAASEHMGSLGTLYAHQEVLLSPVVLARCVIEHAAHAVWILGGKSKAATDRLARAYLEEVNAAEHAKQQASDLLGKQSQEYKLRAGHYREVKKEAKTLFTEPHHDKDGRPMYRGEQLPSPEAAVLHLNRMATRPLSNDQMKGTYGLLSSHVHPTTHIIRELFVVDEVNGQKTPRLTIDISFHDRLARMVVICFYNALSHIVSYHGWVPAAYLELNNDIDALLPGVFIGGPSPGPFDGAPA
jgi:hypothetical protein